MFKKQKITETFYDKEYKELWERGFKFQRALTDAVQTCRIKEIKTHLFPNSTESYTKALEEHKQAQLNVWTAKSDYIVALKKLTEYYEAHYQDFIKCKTYYHPNQWFTPDYVIERAIEKGI